MTCSKCERLIRDGITEEISGVVQVDIDRPEEKAQVVLANNDNLESKKSKILSIVNALVNGKFTAQIDQGC